MMAAAFRSGLPVLFYPEGTTTSGDVVLPFRRGLFNSVVCDRVPVKTAALAYAIDASNVGCTVGEDVCFVGDAEFGPHLFKALGLKGVRVRVRFGAETVAGEDRFALARNARDGVCDLYEEIAGVRGLERGVEFPARQRTQVLDGGVTGGVGALGEAGAQG
jgi:1-acyl-sn-glycerol-3-phosphate acyltransferase